jgi:hypothetical protein
MVGRGVLLVLLASLALGVGSAGGRSLDTTTITVEVIGQGTVKSSDPNTGIKCGGGNNKCYLTFTGGTDVELTADPNNNWSDGTWSDDCSGSTSGSCTLAHGADYIATANFTKSSGVSMKTLSVTYDDTSGDGKVSAPESASGTGSEIDCGSALSATDCTWTVLSGSTLTIFQAPDTGSVFGGWGGACSGTARTCTVQMDDDHTAHATWLGSAGTTTLGVTVEGNGSVSGGGINCSGPATCSANEPVNSTVSLTAEPDEGFVFSGWSTDCSGIGVTCTLTMSAARTVIATFLPTLAVTVNGNGNVSGGTGAINCGTGATVCASAFLLSSTVTLTATPATGSTFLGWTGACGGTATTCTILMNAAKSVTANFSAGPVTANTVALSVSVVGNGRVTGSGISCGLGSTACTANLTLNTNVTLTASPDTGATFTGWGGACSGTTTTCTVAMTIAKSVTATFAGGTTTVQLSVSVSGSGTVTGGGIQCGNGFPVCSAQSALNSSVTLTASPVSGASFSGWAGACTGTTPTCTVLMNSAKSVSATFTGGSAPGTLTLIVSGRGTVSTSAGRCAATGPKKTCVQKFTPGKTVTLTATPASGARFLGWGGGCTGTKRTCTVTLNVGRSLTATFSAATGGAGVLRALAAPTVKRSAKGFLVTLRFSTSRAGLAHVRALRAGRVATSLSLRVAAGPATIGPFTVAKTGLYTFEISLGGHAIHWRTCLGRCGAAAPGLAFLLTREPPTVTRSGDVWSVTLNFRANGISVAHVRASTTRRVLVDQRFLAHTGKIVLGPFLLGPGSYTIRLTATDAYGRTRTLTWVVALAR